MYLNKGIITVIIFVIIIIIIIIIQPLPPFCSAYLVPTTDGKTL